MRPYGDCEVHSTHAKTFRKGGSVKHQRWSGSVSPPCARELSAAMSHLFCLVRPDMLEADYRLSAYKLKHTAFLLCYHFY